MNDETATPTSTFWKTGSITDGFRRLYEFLTAEKWQWILVPLFMFVVSRLGVFLAAYYASILFPSGTAYQYVPLQVKSPILGLLSKWDSEWYLYIATKGYYYKSAGQSPVAFFPLYPLLLKIGYHLLGNNVHLSGLLISNVSFFLGLVLFYRLVEEVYADASVARRAVTYLCIFPASIFFSAIYSEGLYFLLIVTCIVLARKRVWWAAGLCGLLASATRNLGILLLVWVGWDWLQALGWNWRQPFKLPAWSAFRRQAGGLLALALIPTGALAYIAYLWTHFGDPLAFIHAQTGWAHAILGPIRVIADFYTNNSLYPGDPDLTVYHFSLILLYLFLLTTVQISKRMGFGACLFCLASVLIPVSSSLMSLPRFIVPLFPFFMVLAEWGRHRWIDKGILILFPIFLGLFTAVFTTWRFFF
jgi:hypothetical protein